MPSAFASEVSTPAGECQHRGSEDGDAQSALFSTDIQDIACKRDCSLLVTDMSSRKVRQIILDSNPRLAPDGDSAGLLQHAISGLKLV
jgi:hypothetical protein